MNETKSAKHDEASASLPEELRPTFEELVADYRFSAIQHHRHPFVSYVILADLVRIGWVCPKPETGK